MKLNISVSLDGPPAKTPEQIEAENEALENLRLHRLMLDAQEIIHEHQIRQAYQARQAAEAAKPATTLAKVYYLALLGMVLFVPVYWLLSVLSRC